MPLMAVYALQEGIAIDVSTEVFVEPLGPALRGVKRTHVADGVKLPLGSVVPAEAQLLEAPVLARDLLPQPVGCCDGSSKKSFFSKNVLDLPAALWWRVGLAALAPMEVSWPSGGDAAPLRGVSNGHHPKGCHQQ